MTPSIISYLWLLPAAPLAASLLILSINASRRRSAAGVAILGQAIVLVFAVAAFASTLHAAPARSFYNLTWFTVGDQAVRIGWLLDPLTAAMLVMIGLVSLCIFVFSAGYMAGDKNFARFFAYLSFFSAAMLGVVIANSLLLLFVCWELMGLASYLLIGFWIEKPSAAAAARKAFITTRIGDVGFFIGILWLYSSSGNLLFYENGAGCLESGALLAIGSTTSIAMLIFCGAAGKSGQFPLHVWLPDAMEGPTPVSALIHAATMVAAGVFLVARLYPIFSSGAVDGVTPSLLLVVWIGVVTALMASLIAITQTDIKRVLAYSTVSQLGLMMVSLGVGGVAAGIVHLIAHGFFKALLFLGAGSVIHSVNHEQDIRKMGGLRGAMPITFWTYAVGTMTLSGVPLLFSGAWSKEAILHATSEWPSSRMPHYLIMAGVVLTALYMTRQVLFVFFGDKREASRAAHENGWEMTMPLLVLAVCTVALSVALTPAWPWLQTYLSEAGTEPVARSFMEPMLFVSFVLVGAGIALGWLIYRHAGESDPVEHAQPALFRFLANRMWMDEIYAAFVVAPAARAARFSDWMDRHFWDGLVRATGGIGDLAGVLTKSLDERAINAGVDGASGGTRGLGRLMSLAHSGQIRNYLRFAGASVLAVLLLYAWLG